MIWILYLLVGSFVATYTLKKIVDHEFSSGPIRKEDQILLALVWVCTTLIWPFALLILIVAFLIGFFMGEADAA